MSFIVVCLFITLFDLTLEPRSFARVGRQLLLTCITSDQRRVLDADQNNATCSKYPR